MLRDVVSLSPSMFAGGPNIEFLCRLGQALQRLRRDFSVAVHVAPSKDLNGVRAIEVCKVEGGMGGVLR